MTKNYEAFAAAHKDAVDAFMQFNKTLAQGMQEITEHMLALTKRTMETHIETGKAVVAVKTPQELTDLHSNWATQVFESAMTGSMKLSELSAKISTQATAPIQSHLSGTMSKITDSLSSLNKAA